MAASSDETVLKWNRHNDALASFLYSQLEKESFIDVTIAAEGKCINVHRLVLCASSSYFENLLGQFDKPAVVILQNIKFSDVQLIVEYIYKGEISVSNNQLSSFLKAAKCLHIKGLTSEGNHHGQVQDQNIVDDEVAPIQEEAESVDDQVQAMLSDLEENLNHHQGDPDVVIVDAPPRPPPMLINLDGSLVEDDPDVTERMRNGHEDEMETNQDGDSSSNSSVDEDSSSCNSGDDDEEREPRRRLDVEPVANGDRLTNSRFFRCGACGRDFKKMCGLKRHEALAPNGDCRSVPYFRCTLCGVCEGSRGYLRYHLSGCHKNVLVADFRAHITEIKATLPKFECKLCPRRFNSKSCLRKHKRSKHRG